METREDYLRRILQELEAVERRHNLGRSPVGARTSTTYLIGEGKKRLQNVIAASPVDLQVEINAALEVLLEQKDGLVTKEDLERKFSEATSNLYRLFLPNPSQVNPSRLDSVKRALLLLSCKAGNYKDSPVFHLTEVATAIGVDLETTRIAWNLLVEEGYVVGMGHRGREQRFSVTAQGIQHCQSIELEDQAVLAEYPPTDRQSPYRRTLDWFENHPVLGPVFALMGILVLILALANGVRDFLKPSKATSEQTWQTETPPSHPSLEPSSTTDSISDLP